MEIKVNEIIANVIRRCGREFTTEQYRRIKESLEIELNDCVVEKKCYDLVSVSCNDIYLKNFVASLKLSGRSDRTIKQYVRETQKMLLGIGKEAKDITKNDLKAYYATYKYEHNISNTTLENMQRYIRAFFNFLTQEEYVEKNVAVYIETPKTRKPDIYPFTGEEIEIMRETIRTQKENRARNIALFEFLLSTGCRVSEVANIKISDVDFISNTVIVTGKGNKTRRVYFTSGTLKYLKDYLNGRTDCADILFYSPRTKKGMTKGSIEKFFKRLCGNEIHCNPHRFRHNFAQTCIDRGMAVEDLKQLLGHEDISTTMRYYKENPNKAHNAYKQYIA